jgi:hypothetical protein
MLGDLANRLSTVEGNIYPDDPSAQLQLLMSEIMNMDENGTISVGVYGTQAFILDHPVYCNLNSSILRLDENYAFGPNLTQTFT